MADSALSKIVIVDFGSQYTQVIARRVRECQVYSQIVRFDTPAEEIAALNPRGIILSAALRACMEKVRHNRIRQVFQLRLPVLGICYGMQLMAHHLGGKVEYSERREYGSGQLQLTKECELFHGLAQSVDVWNSHGDKLTKLPKGFRTVGCTDNSSFAAIEEPKKKFYGLQFHPEVAHTPRGKEIIQNFVYKICGCTMDWTMGGFIEETCEQIRNQVGDAHVILGLSGGVDSSVAAALLHKAIGDQLTCVFVTTGSSADKKRRRCSASLATIST
jgi:GMP synthase (glutamine-hydrolysing)